MSRYRGPRLRVMRALGEDLPGLSRKRPERKPYPPGQHQGRSRQKKSTFAQQLIEKQKLRYNYGLTDRQLRRVMKKAVKHKGSPGENLLRLLESRLDNAVFRAGFAPTIPAARQLIAHGHIQVNGRRVDIPSFQVESGQSLQVAPSGRRIPIVESSWAHPPLDVPSWIRRSEDYSAHLVARPDRDGVPFSVDPTTVVEFYTRKL